MKKSFYLPKSEIFKCLIFRQMYSVLATKARVARDFLGDGSSLSIINA